MNLFRHLRLPQDPFWRNCERKFEFSELSSLRVFPSAEFSSAEAKKTSWRTPQKQAWYEYRRIHICRGNSESCPNRIKELETCSRDWSDRNYNEGPHLKENRLIRLKTMNFMRATDQGHINLTIYSRKSGNGIGFRYLLIENGKNKMVQQQQHGG